VGLWRVWFLYLEDRHKKIHGTQVSFGPEAHLYQELNSRLPFLSLVYSWPTETRRKGPFLVQIRWQSKLSESQVDQTEAFVQRKSKSCVLGRGRIRTWVRDTASADGSAATHGPEAGARQEYAGGRGAGGGAVNFPPLPCVRLGIAHAGTHTRAGRAGNDGWAWWRARRATWEPPIAWLAGLAARASPSVDAPAPEPGRRKPHALGRRRLRRWRRGCRGHGPRCFQREAAVLLIACVHACARRRACTCA